MSIIENALKLAGKEDFKLDKRISKGYLIHLCIQYSAMLIRGFVRSVGNANIDSNIFIGKNVKLYAKKYIKIGAKTKLHDFVKIDALSIQGVEIGKYCVIGKGSCIECTGTLHQLGVGLKIGNGTSFGFNCYFGAAGGIKIGNDVIAGQYIRFHSENHIFDDLQKLIKEQGVTHHGIRIGNNCWIGAGAVFLDGAEIGNGCVVAANAVVLGKFGDNVIIGGIPAKVLGKR